MRALLSKHGFNEEAIQYISKLDATYNGRVIKAVGHMNANDFWAFYRMFYRVQRVGACQDGESIHEDYIAKFYSVYSENAHQYDITVYILKRGSTCETI